jgi:hypothetical protein
MAEYRGDATYWNTGLYGSDLFFGGHKPSGYDFGIPAAGKNGPMWHAGGMNRSQMGFNDPIRRDANFKPNGHPLVPPEHVQLDESRLPKLAGSKSATALMYHQVDPATAKPVASWLAKWTQNDGLGHGTFLWGSQHGPQRSQSEADMSDGAQRLAETATTILNRPPSFPPHTGWHHGTSDFRINPLGKPTYPMRTPGWNRGRI